MTRAKPRGALTVGMPRTRERASFRAVSRTLGIEEEPRAKPARVQPRRRVRYAVVGIGHIAQVAVLPAFAHAKENSELAALVSDDATKLAVLSKKYRVADAYTYDRYEECLRSGRVDAVYVALPNTLHAPAAIAAANAGVHVLCEKPMATTEAECAEMIEAADANDVRLMVAYRLHFDRANLDAVATAHAKRLGELRLFDSVFAMQVEPDNIRTRHDLGGGPLNDIGIYCLNAARYLFRDEPIEISAFAAASRDKRFQEVPEAVSVLLRFPGARLASFTCSFGAADVGRFQLVGTRGHVELNPAYEYAEPLKSSTTIDGKKREKRYGKEDQFAPELVYFSRCILEHREPEPSGEEGLADVRVLEAIRRSIQERRPVELPVFGRTMRPTPRQAMKRPPVRKPRVIHAKKASRS